MINDIKKARELFDKGETEKMLNVIHKNAQKGRDKYIISKNLKTIKREKKEKQSKWFFRIATALVVVLIISLFVAYENKQNDNCVEAGHDRNWCIING